MLMKHFVKSIISALDLRKRIVELLLAACMIAMLVPPVTATAAVGIPQNFKVTKVDDTSVTFSWSAVPGSTYYEIHQDGKAKTWPWPNSTSATITGLSPNTTYTFKIRSFNGSVYSGFSPTLTVTTTISMPYNLKATAISTDSITLSWSAVTGARSYEVYKDNKNIAQPKSPSYTVTGLSPNTSYTFKVRSFNGTEYSRFTYLTSTTRAEFVGVPQYLRPTLYSRDTVVLGWNPVTGADFYEIYRADPSKGYQSIFIGRTTITACQITGLSHGTTYYFGVRACKGNSCSDIASVTVTTHQ